MKRRGDLLRCDAIELRHDALPEAVLEHLAKPEPPQENKPYIVEGVALRAGILRYGDTTEYNPPELINQELAASMEGLPVLLLERHPRGESQGRPRFFDRRETEMHTVGTILAAEPLPHLEPPLMKVRVSLVRQDAKEAVHAKRQHKLSLGYGVKLDNTPGTTPGGEPYDTARTAIDPEHLLLTDNPRAGGLAALRTDKADRPGGKKIMAKFTIDGVEYETEDAALAQAVVAQVRRADTAQEKLTALQTDMDKVKVRADTAEEKLEEAQQKIQTLEAARGDSEALAAHVKLCQQAAPLLADKGLDELVRMDAAQIHRAVNATQTKRDLSGESDVYHQVRFDQLMEAREEVQRKADQKEQRRQDALDKGNKNAGKGEEERHKRQDEGDQPPSLGASQAAMRADSK